MKNTSFLLYGANGYTGELIARYAGQYGLQPILAGRRKEVIEPLAARLGLPYLVFDLNDSAALHDALRQVSVVIHAAGPFSRTAKAMVEACLQAGVHYLDINGDISVFEFVKSYHDQAVKAGVMLLPGAGFDVVPTDCIALQLKKQLPDAVSLQLAFATLGGGISHGTALTMSEKIGDGGAVRREGKIVRAPLGGEGMTLDFNGKFIFVMSIPWGDISTAFHTTGIPNITTYTGMSKKVYSILKFQSLFNWLLRTRLVRNYLKSKIDSRPPGPSDQQREKATAFVWGRATNASGRSVTLSLQGPEGYTLTTHSALIIAKKVLEGNFRSGYQTPGSAYGEDLVLEIPGVVRSAVKYNQAPF